MPFSSELLKRLAYPTTCGSIVCSFDGHSFTPLLTKIRAGLALLDPVLGSRLLPLSLSHSPTGRQENFFILLGLKHSFSSVTHTQFDGSVRIALSTS